ERVELNRTLGYWQRFQMSGGVPKLAGQCDVRDVAILNQSAQRRGEVGRIGEQALDEGGCRWPVLRGHLQQQGLPAQPAVMDFQWHFASGCKAAQPLGGDIYV